MKMNCIIVDDEEMSASALKRLLSGMDLLKQLNTRALIILTTSHTEYALEAYE